MVIFLHKRSPRFLGVELETYWTLQTRPSPLTAACNITLIPILLLGKVRDKGKVFLEGFLPPKAPALTRQADFRRGAGI